MFVVKLEKHVADKIWQLIPYSEVQLPTMKCMALNLNKSVSEELSVLWKVI